MLRRPPSSIDLSGFHGTRHQRRQSKTPPLVLGANGLTTDTGTHGPLTNPPNVRAPEICRHHKQGRLPYSRPCLRPGTTGLNHGSFTYSCAWPVIIIIHRRPDQTEVRETGLLLSATWRRDLIRIATAATLTAECGLWFRWIVFEYND